MKRPARPSPSSVTGDPPRKVRSDRGLLLASLILVLALSATLLGWYQARKDARAANQERFRDCISELLVVIHQAVTAREGILRGGAALFRASEMVSVREWQAYVTSLTLASDFPDITTLGYAPQVTPKELPQLAATIAQQGITEFRIHPRGDQPLLAPVLYENPPRQLRGFNLQADPDIRMALEQARMEASAVLTPPLELGHERAPTTAAVLMVYPVYRGRMPAAADARDEKVIGFVFSEIEIKPIIERALGQRLEEFEVQIYDGADMSRLLYDSTAGSEGDSRKSRVALSALTSVVAAEREWTIRFTTLPRFENRLQLYTEHVILASGSIISLLLFAISLTLATTRHRARQLAGEMNRAFLEERARLQEITATLGEGLYVQDINGKITFTNPAAEQILGRAPGELLGRASTDIMPASAIAAGIGLNPHAFERRDRKIFASEETTFLHKNGTPIPVSIVSSPILRDGNPVGSVIAFQDISERKRAEIALRTSQQFEALFRYSSDALFLMDMDGRVLDANPVAQETLGYTREELSHCAPGTYVRWSTAPQPGQTLANFFASLNPAQKVRGEAEYVRKDCSSFIVEAAFSVIVLENRQLVLVSARDITERKEAERRIQHALDELERSRREVEEANERLAESNQELQGLSRRDSLTAIPNRRSFDEYMDLEWNRAARDHRPLSLLIIDVDHFKRFNDRYGHQAGDECLRRLAASLEQQLSRSIDMVARYGGEEFVVVLPETPLAGAINIAERLRRGVEELNMPHDASPVAAHVTISIGVAAVVPRPGESRDRLLAAADAALYQAKQTGRNRVCAFTQPVE